MGRKPLPLEDRRAKPLRIRLTGAERDEIDKAANRAIIDMGALGAATRCQEGHEKIT
jgi:hypothetical protein